MTESRPFVTEQKQDGVSVIALGGNLTFASYRALKQVFERLHGSNECRVVLDLKDCTYMDSAGLGLIASFVASFRQRNGDIRLLHVAPALRETLNITRLIKFFKLYTMLDDAVKSFSLDPPKAG